MLSAVSEGPSDFLVLGGGLAGLTFALEVARRGRRAIVLESEEEVGGLARTLSFGEYRFDLGGHRYHSEWPEVTAWVLDVLDGEVLEVTRRSRIYLDGRYVDYPLRLPNAVTVFPATEALRILASYLAARLRRDRRPPDVSFEDWVDRQARPSLRLRVPLPRLHSGERFLPLPVTACPVTASEAPRAEAKQSPDCPGDRFGHSTLSQ